jgi:hypothetical protein
LSKTRIHPKGVQARSNLGVIGFGGAIVLASLALRG